MTPSLLNELNDRFDGFKTKNAPPSRKTSPLPRDQVLTMSLDSMRKINACQDLGTDNIPDRVLRDSAEELTDVLTDNP